MSKETVIVQFTSQFTLALGTSFVASAIIIRSASQHANAIGTDHSIGTSVTRETGVGNTNALHLCIASKPFWTNTLFPVIRNRASSIGATRISGTFARVNAISSLADFIGIAVAICGTGSSKRSNALETFANTISRTIRIGTTQFLYASDLLIFGVSKKSFWTNA